MQYCYYNYDYEEIVVVVVVVRREWGWYIGKREVLSKAYKQQNKEQQPQYVVVKCITNTSPLCTQFTSSSIGQVSITVTYYNK